MITLLAVVVGIGTVAYFSDTETSRGNVFSAGTLDLTIQLSQAEVVNGYGNVDVHPDTDVHNGVNVYFVVSNVAPGSAGVVKWTLKNVGSIPGILSFTVGNITNNENGQTEPEALVDSTTDVGELGEKMTVTLWIDLNGNGVRDDGELLYSGNLNGMSRTYSNLITLSPNGGSVDVYLEWSIPINVGNEIQSDSVSFDITFMLNQA